MKSQNSTSSHTGMLDQHRAPQQDETESKALPGKNEPLPSSATGESSEYHTCPEEIEPLPSSQTGESSNGYIYIPVRKKIVAKAQELIQLSSCPKDDNIGQESSSSTLKVEASEPVKSRKQNSSDSSAPTLPDILQKAVGIYKPKIRDLSIPPVPEDMTPKKVLPNSILRRDPENPPNTNNDNGPHEAPANKLPSTPKVQFIILKRPGGSPAGQVKDAANVNREESAPPRVTIPGPIAILTTSDGIADGAPVGQSMVEPKTGLADPTDRDFFWNSYGDEMYPFPLHITKPIKRVLLRAVDAPKNKPDESRVQESRNYVENLAEDTDRSQFLWNHRMTFEKDLGQLMDVKTHHTAGLDEDTIQAPPQFIDNADFIPSSGESPAEVDPDEIQLESLISLYEYQDWKLRDDWRTWRMLPTVPGEIGARIEKQYADCTRQQLVWIEIMYCSVRKLGDVRLRSSEVRNMFRERFECEIPKDWKGLAAEISRDASRKMLKYRMKSPGC